MLNVHVGNVLRLPPICIRCSAVWMKCQMGLFPSDPIGLARQYPQYRVLSTDTHKNSVDSEIQIHKVSDSDTISSQYFTNCKHKGISWLASFRRNISWRTYSTCVLHLKRMSLYVHEGNQEGISNQDYVGKTRLKRENDKNMDTQYSIIHSSLLPKYSRQHPAFPLPTASSSFASPVSSIAKALCGVKFNSNSLGSVALIRFYRGQARHRGDNQTFRRKGEDESESDSYPGNYLVDDDAESSDERAESILRQNKMVKIENKSQNNLQPSSSQMTFTEAPDDLPEMRRTVDELTLPEMSRTVYNIVPYVKRSVTLQNLVRLGVNLDKIQKEKGIAELLIKSNFERDILPYFKFLSLVGVELSKMGYVFTANPRLFKESVQDLELRIGYLLHKDFTLPEIVSIITTAPVVLLMDPWMLDEKLGFLQKAFDLTDTEVRDVVTRYAKLLPRRKELIADVRFHVKEFIGFTDPELKQLMLKDPKIFAITEGALVDRFDYLHNTMLITHEQILVWPKILRIRLYIFKNRHLFLLSRGRAQYDPCLENFVSLEALGSYTDEEFCQKVAKCDVQEFYDFCKTL